MAKAWVAPYIGWLKQRQDGALESTCAQYQRRFKLRGQFWSSEDCPPATLCRRTRCHLLSPSSGIETRAYDPTVVAGRRECRRKCNAPPWCAGAENSWTAGVSRPTLVTIQAPSGAAFGEPIRRAKSPRSRTATKQRKSASWNGGTGTRSRLTASC